MRFVTFRRDGAAGPGLLTEDGRIVDLVAAIPEAAEAGTGVFDRPVPSDLAGCIAAGRPFLTAAEAISARVADGGLAAAVYPAESCELLAPIPRPSKNVFCVGRNYAEHVAEGYRARNEKQVLPEHPQIFTKPPTAVIGPDAAVRLDSRVTEKLDYEVELTVVIGRRGRDIPAAEARDHIFGFTIANDITAREVQRRHGQWFKGKGLDSSCPMGPHIVSLDQLPNFDRLDIGLTVNGERRQNSNTRHMIFPIPEIIEVLSMGMTLEPGDLIMTGTPSGVGYAMTPPRFLAPGDEVACTIEGIGTLSNRIVAAEDEPAPSRAD